jgi:glucose-1-phosphate adenylyltransferase
MTASAFSTERSPVLSIVLAGGEGKRLLPLTEDRAKPAVPFGGHYRLIDFAISNLVNGGFRKIVVLTQYKSHSLDVHISRTWQLSTLLGNYVTPVPAQMRKGPRWFTGSADAIFQNLNILDDERPAHVIVFGADHIYRIDPRQMLQAHMESGAGITIAAIRVPKTQASEFGVIEKDRGSTRVAAFHEKPAEPPTLDDDPEQCLVSMGNYIFDTRVLIDAVTADATDPASRHDIGGNLIPSLVAASEAHVYDYTTNSVPGETARDRHYWRDVGTLDAYYEAHMDLVAPLPIFNLYNDQWPIFTEGRTLPPAKVVDDGETSSQVSNSILSNGVIVSGAVVRNSILSPGVHVEGEAVVDGAVLMDDVRIERGARVRRCIVDKNVVVPAGMVIGEDAAADGERFTVTAAGIVAIAKNATIRL